MEFVVANCKYGARANFGAEEAAELFNKAIVATANIAKPQDGRQLRRCEGTKRGCGNESCESNNQSKRIGDNHCGDLERVLKIGRSGIVSATGWMARRDEGAYSGGNLTTFREVDVLLGETNLWRDWESKPRSNEASRPGPPQECLRYF